MYDRSLRLEHGLRLWVIDRIAEGYSPRDILAALDDEASRVKVRIANATGTLATTA